MLTVKEAMERMREKPLADFSPDEFETVWRPVVYGLVRYFRGTPEEAEAILAAAVARHRNRLDVLAAAERLLLDAWLDRPTQ